MDLPAPDEETMIKVAVADLDDRLPSIDKSRIEESVRHRVQDLSARARVKTFVGIIAERQARADLERSRTSR